MGRMGAESMIEEAGIDRALVWHLQSNHYPPIPVSMVAPCKRAIKKANAGEWDAKVRLPEGITYKGSTMAPVRAMIEQHHLDSFLEDNGEYYE